MILLYTTDNGGHKAGAPVQIDDYVTTHAGETVRVTGWREPHKPSSSGHVYVYELGIGEREYFPSVIGAAFK